METLSTRDREILRRQAQSQLDYAKSPQNDIILKKWEAQAEGRRETPPVRLLFSNFCHEVITPRLRCEGKQARGIESQLLGTLVGRELFDDDTPISPTFDMGWHVHVQPFGIAAKVTRAAGPNAQGFHIDPVIGNLAAEIDRLRGGSFGVDREGTARRVEFLQELFGDILAEFVTCDGSMNEEAIMTYFKGVCEAARGYLFEIAQREVGTIFGDSERGRRYVRLAKEAVDRYWRP